MDESLSVVEEPKAPIPMIPKGTLIPAILCDLDGTLALKTSDRSIYDWSRVGEDSVAPHVHKMLKVYFESLHFQIIYLTGRDEEAREKTEEWLNTHKCPPGPLIMRRKGDRRSSETVKAELYAEHVLGKYSVEFVLEDWDKCVGMWRFLGLNCFQVSDGRF